MVGLPPSERGLARGLALPLVLPVLTRRDQLARYLVIATARFPKKMGKQDTRGQLGPLSLLHD